MPAKNHLSKEQKERLLKEMRENEKAQIRERILILLLMNEGKTYQEIANFLEISYPTVAYWAVHGDPDKMESFIDGRSQGNFRKATPEYEEMLLELVEKEPSEYGYEFGRWTSNRLATYLEQATGIKLSGSQVRRILGRKKYVYLWAKYSLEEKQNPMQRKGFKEKLLEYLKIAEESPERLQVWFWDEVGFSLRVIRRKTWGKKGSRKKVTGQRRNGRVNLMGGLRYTDKKRINFVINKGESETFYQQIKAFHNCIIEEWVESGKPSEDFLETGPKVVVILDNASFHKKKEILEKIELEMPNMGIHLLRTN